MDLRTKRTTLAIKNAFLELRKTTNIQKIKVTKICEIAMINKATFYNYYESIEHLIDILDNEYVDNIISSLKDHPLKYYSKEFLDEICNALENRRDEISIHFQERQNVLFYKLIDRIKEEYLSNNIPKEEIIKNIFLASGGIITILYFIFYENFDKELVTSTLSKIINRLDETI